jgi:hypothetical protein
LGKANDKKEETGIGTWDRRSRGPGIWGKICRDSVGKVPLAAEMLVATCKDSLNEAKAEIEERQTGLAHEFV